VTVPAMPIPTQSHHSVEHHPTMFFVLPCVPSAWDSSSCRATLLLSSPTFLLVRQEVKSNARISPVHMHRLDAAGFLWNVGQGSVNPNSSVRALIVSSNQTECVDVVRTCLDVVPPAGRLVPGYTARVRLWHITFSITAANDNERRKQVLRRAQMRAALEASLTVRAPTGGHSGREVSEAS
jgi:hypothetical protein